MLWSVYKSAVNYTDKLALISHYYHSLLVDTTIMLSNKCQNIGKQVKVIFRINSLP